MWLVLLLLVLISPFLLLVLWELIYYRRNRLINNFPGPKPLPLIGNAHQFGRGNNALLKAFFNLWEGAGKTNYRIWVGLVPNITLTEVPDIEFVLTSNTLIQKGEIYGLFEPWLGQGLLTAFGNRWFKHRKMITPSFHFKILQNFHETMNTSSTKFIEKLRAISAGDTIFDFQDIVHNLTLDVICETAMGVSIHAMDDEENALVMAFKFICHSLNNRAFHPVWSKNFFYQFTSEYPEYRKQLKVLKDFTHDIIEKRMEALKNKDENEDTNDDDTSLGYRRKKQAFLDTLLTSTVDGRPLTINELDEEVSTFMFEGHDTTASGIGYTVYMLSRHPEIQKKVYEEQKSIMGSNMQGEATFQEIADMKYLDLVLKEAQRLYPSVPFIARVTEKEYVMNGKVLPKGTNLNIFIMAMGYNEKVFPDPYRCDPERHSMEDANEKVNPFNHVPFSAGPRNCIGQKFALLELKTVVAKIVRSFEILPPLDELISTDGYVEHCMGLSMEEQQKREPKASKYNPILEASLTLQSANGIQIRLRPRT